MFKALKYRIYPNDEQKNQMEATFGSVRFLYNQYLSWYNNEYNRWKENGKIKGDFKPLPLVTYFKHDYDWLKNIDNAALAYARTNFMRALSNFFESRKGKRKGKRVGFPKFKKKGKAKFTYRTCDAHGGIRIKDGMIRIPKIGWVNILLHRPLEGNIKSATIEKKKSGAYYISLMIECGDVNTETKSINKDLVVGLDMSLERFLVSSNEEDNMKIKYCRNFRKEEKAIKKLNRDLSRKELVETDEIYVTKKGIEKHKKKPSNNRERARIKLAKRHERIANRRKDFIIKTACYLTRKYDVIVIEDLNMRDMARSLNLGKSVMDLGWGMFKRWLQIEADKNGCIIVKADKWFPSSKICNGCGEKNTELQLSDRSWVCPHCGCIISDRDFNAALNLRDYYLANFEALPGEPGEVKRSGDKASMSCENEVRFTDEVRNELFNDNSEAPSFR